MKSTTFLEKCKGIALVFSTFSLMLFGAAALVFSISPAQATNTPQTVYGAGKYQMELSTVMSNDNKSYWYILVWDTETGRSKMYYGSVKEGTNSALSKFDLPSSPL